MIGYFVLSYFTVSFLILIAFFLRAAYLVKTKLTRANREPSYIDTYSNMEHIRESMSRDFWEHMYIDHLGNMPVLILAIGWGLIVPFLPFVYFFIYGLEGFLSAIERIFLFRTFKKANDMLDIKDIIE